MTKRPISGVLLLDKPYGITSNKALQIIKYCYAATKCGHTGTLDPLATGMLPICLGEATKFSSILLEAPKTYEAVLKLGFHSSTGDAEGEVEKILDAQSLQLTLQDCAAVLTRFEGEIEQTPPMYSALKHQGKPLYAYARKGEDIQRQTRTVFIYALEAVAYLENELTIRVSCATGTYIRTLAEDIGKAMGCGSAYLVKLRRSSVGAFELQQAQSLPTIEALDLESRDKCLLPVDCMLTHVPLIEIDEKTAQQLLQGRVLPVPIDFMNRFDTPAQRGDTHTVRLYYRQHFLGLAEVSLRAGLKTKRLLSNDYLARHCRLSIS